MADHDDKAGKVDLMRFTFQSLYFCATPIEHLPGERFVAAVNQWYMPLIRSGWAVPLSFVLDVGSLLQRPSTALRSRWKENTREEIRQLSLRYHQMLISLRRQPIVAATVDLIARSPVQARRDQATKMFLRFLLAELSHFRNTYTFDSRDLKLSSARPVADGIRDVKMVFKGKQQTGTIVFGDPARIEGKNEFGTIVDLLTSIIDYFSEHQLNTFMSPEEQLIVEISGRTSAAASRIDYRFLHELLSRADLDDVEEQTPWPPRVEQIVPTDSYEVDGQVGGYIDVNRRRFTGNLAEVLPLDLSLLRHPALIFQKLLNEGALHFVREDIECIERELRLLFCFVIDVNERMLAAPAHVHETFGKGMTPYIRARVLASLLLRDLARYLPRDNVQADCAMFFWSRQARHTYRTEFDLFSAFSRKTAGDRFRFIGEFADYCPYVFYNRLPAQASRENPALDQDPCQYILHRSRTRIYHGRHVVFFTSSHSAPYAFPTTDPGLATYDSSRDSLFAIACDVRRTTVGVARPRSMHDAVDLLEEGSAGQLNEERLRARIIDTVLMKNAGGVPSSEEYETLSDLT